MGSGVEVPAKDRDFYALKNVPHGQLREIYFYSPSTDTNRRAFVYTPRATMLTRVRVIQFFICNMVGEKMNMAGVLRGMRL